MSRLVGLLRTRTFFTAAALAAALACLVGTAILDDKNGFLANLADDVLGVLGGLLVGAAGINQLGPWFLRRARAYQISRTLFDYMGLMINELAEIAGSAYSVIEEACQTPPTSPVGW